MAEGTHTSERMYDLLKGTGKGGKLWAGLVAVANGQTIDVGISQIYGIGVCNSANFVHGSHVISVSGSVLTFTTGGAATPYVVVVGRSF